MTVSKDVSGLARKPDGNEGKEARFDCVPFAGRGRIMCDRDRQLLFRGQGLRGLLPRLVAHAIAASSISRDGQLVCLGIEPLAAVFPPPPILSTASSAVS